MDELIKKDIESDFEKCIARFYNVKILMRNLSNVKESKNVFL